MGARRLLVSLGVALGTSLMLGLGASPASAHAYLASSNPADGASLPAAPRTIELHFTEHVVLEATEITVVQADGRRVALTGLTLVESDEDREAPSTVVAPAPSLGVGAYHVSWRTLSSDDLHSSTGTFAFGIQSEVQATGPSETNPDPAELAGRWAVLAGIGAGLGAVVVGRLLRRLTAATSRMPRAWLDRQAGRLLGVAATATLAVTLVDLARFGSGAFSAGYATRWGLRETALVVAAVVLGRRSRRLAVEPSDPPVGPRGDATVATALAAAALLTVSLGHFGLRGGATWVITSTAHLVAALLWAGSVAALALLGLRSTRLGLSRQDVRAVLRSFRGPAMLSVAVIAVSGLYLASDVVVSVDALLVTAYGRILLAKVALTGVVGLLALATTRRLHARQGRDPRARQPRVGLEAVGLLVVVALAGVLATGQPAVSPRLVTEETPSVIDDRPVADLQQTLALRPNRPGASLALIDVLDTRRPAPGPVTGVSVTVRDPRSDTEAVSSGPARSGTVAATAVTRSRWSAPLVLPGSGPVDLDVLVHRRGLADVRSTVRWVVGPGVAEPATVVSRAPLSGRLAWASAALALVLLVATLLLRRRRRPTASTAATGREPDPREGQAGSSEPGVRHRDPDLRAVLVSGGDETSSGRDER